MQVRWILAILAVAAKMIIITVDTSEIGRCASITWMERKTSCDENDVVATWCILKSESQKMHIKFSLP